MASLAKNMNKPFYVCAESFKFVRLYPLGPRDLPEELKVGCLQIYYFIIMTFSTKLRLS